MRLAVYTIALNEINEVAGWLAATEHADVRVVADTGSTDGTDLALQAAGVSIFHATVQPWRFDDAFNTALALIPKDVDVCFRVDMDERPRSGWRPAIDAAIGDATLLRYPYNWNPNITFYCDRIHRRVGYRWRGATHEGLVWRGDGEERQKFIDTLVVDHFQKSKNRPNDLHLLQEAVTEFPLDARLCLYYARELVWHHQSDALTQLRRFQDLSNVSSDLAYARRLMAKADPQHALDHLIQAESLDPTASVYLDLADYWYDHDWQQCHRCIITCLNKISPIGNWTDDLRLKTSYPHDIATIAAWHVGLVSAAIGHATTALAYNPTDKRLQNNLEWLTTFAGQ